MVRRDLSRRGARGNDVGGWRQSREGPSAHFPNCSSLAAADSLPRAAPSGTIHLPAAFGENTSLHHSLGRLEIGSGSLMHG